MIAILGTCTLACQHDGVLDLVVGDVVCSRVHIRFSLLRMRGGCRSCMGNYDKLQSCKAVCLVSDRKYHTVDLQLVAPVAVPLVCVTAATASASRNHERIGIDIVHVAARSMALTFAQDVAAVDEQHLHGRSA